MSERPRYPIDDYVPLMERVRRCEREGWGIRVVGGQTAGSPSDNGDGACVDLIESGSLSKVVDHAAADMTITVQSGVTVAELQRVLRTANQHLPIDVPWPERSTVGGMISKALAGSRRFSRGTVRDLLIGVAVVGAGGALIRGGGRVVKNVAGYDLCKLYTGAWGWLGVVVEGTFKVAAIPESSAAISAEFSDLESVSAAVDVLMASRLSPSSMDLFAGQFVHNTGLIDETDETGRCLQIVVGFEGMCEAVDSQSGRCHALLEPLCGAIAVLDGNSYAAARQYASDMLLERNAMRIGVKPSDVPALAAELLAADRTTVIAAHLGDGIVLAKFNADRIDWNAIAAVIRRFDGHWIIPSLHTTPGDAIAMTGPRRGDWPIMRKVKEVLDPAGIFGRDTGFDRALRDC